jgi:hypothetical protein
MTLDVGAHLARCSGVWRPVAPASKAALAHLTAAAPIDLPGAYAELLSVSNGGEGDLGVDPGWIALWPAEHVLQWNADYEIEDYAPGFFGFASNGGGDLLALDVRSGPPYQVVAIPFIGMDPSEAVVIAPDFDSLVLAIGTPMPAA